MINFEKVKADERYEDFTYLDEPVAFGEFFKNEDFDRVQVHDVSTITTNDGKEFYCGFCGVFSWKSGILESLDGDCYSSSVKIYGYDKFIDEEDGKCVDILTGNDWL